MQVRRRSIAIPMAVKLLLPTSPFVVEMSLLSRIDVSAKYYVYN